MSRVSKSPSCKSTYYGMSTLNIYRSLTWYVLRFDYVVAVHLVQFLNISQTSVQRLCLSLNQYEFCC